MNLDETNALPTDGTRSTGRQTESNEAIGSQIGPYKLLQEIGEGGMGTVYMAQQEKPVKRRVALKIIKPGMDSKQVVARFEAERQALAMMDHYNIAKVLDVGTTNHGRPYFVMELIKGLKINRYCDSKKLTIRQRLQLFKSACDAVQHAHQKGIIHRDLKPSNILVADYDGKPVPKIIDFGLAKALHQQLTDRTMFTQLGQVVGTLEYMSPEQSSMNQLEVDTRTDIYSLGVLLYELLSGTVPFDKKRMRSGALDQVLKIIREEDPPMPSHRLSSVESSAEIALHRGTEPKRLGLLLRGDLDWIVIKAMEKDRDRRYESASGLALDIDRYLRNEEVRARPPTTVYRLQKFYKRNKKLVSALLLIGLILLLGAIGTGFGLVWALREQRLATHAAEAAVIAKNEAQKARSIAETQLRAIRLKSAHSDWQLGNVESAWQELSLLAPADMGWESHYLKTELSFSRDVLYGHAMPVTSIDASNDGRFLATASEDNTIKVWDARTKQVLYTVYTDELPNQVCFTPDSTRVAYVDRSNQITMFDSDSGGNIHPVGEKFKEDITCIAFLGDGTKLVTGTSDLDLQGRNRSFKRVAEVKPLVRVLSVDDGVVLAELAGHVKSINAIDCSSDGQYIVSCSSDSTIRIWKKGDNGFALMKTLTAHYPEVLQVKISPTDKNFASCGKDSTVRLWELESGDPIQTIVGHADSVNGLCYSSDGSQIVSVSSDQTARIWNLLGEELRVYQGHFAKVNRVCYSADDGEFFTGSDDCTVRYYQALSRTNTVAIRAHQDVVWQAAFSPDDRRLVTVSEDGSVSIIDAQSGHRLNEKIQLKDAILSVAHSPRANLFVTGGADATFSVFESDSGRLLKTVDAHDDYIWDLAFSPDGHWLATASADYSVKIWNTTDWSEKRQFRAHRGEVGSVQFSIDGNYIATGGDDKKVKLWDASSGELVCELEGHQHSVWRAIFSPTDPNLIASSSYDGEIIFWDIENQKMIGEPIVAHKNQIAGLAFTKDGTRILSASDDQTIRIWDVESGIELFVMRDTDDTAIVAAAFSNDGSRLVTGNRDGWVTVRSAIKSSVDYQPFLPMDSIQIARDVNTALQTECETTEDFARQLKLAQQCCQHFPTYVTFTNQGIAQYRLGRYAESIASLLEAQRLEPLMYGEPDLPPYIEGYLILAYLKNGQLVRAEEINPVFTAKCDAKSWNESEPVQALIDEIAAAYESLSETSPR